MLVCLRKGTRIEQNNTSQIDVFASGKEKVEDVSEEIEKKIKYCLRNQNEGFPGLKFEITKQTRREGRARELNSDSALVQEMFDKLYQEPRRVRRRTNAKSERVDNCSR